ncbi:MAG TPA: DUF3072 domain-containing protein, partial [Chitinophagaceae bacterium]|nr:DUF3072 domain-containing protein [Chitinophagaceae bacterium]
PVKPKTTVRSTTKMMWQHVKETVAYNAAGFFNSPKFVVLFLLYFTKIISMATTKNAADDQRNQAAEGASNTVKNPDDWTTGAEQMTGAQQSYLKTLSEEAGEEVDDSLTKAEASKRIDELQHQTGRGLDTK